MSGWVKSHRKILVWEWYTCPNMFHVFQHLILKANHVATQWRGENIERGQLLTGRKRLSIETGVSERAIRTCLKNLSKTGEISVRTTKAFSVITVCNYDDYQVAQSTSDQQTTNGTTNKRPTSDQRNDHIQEEKNLKNVKKVKNTKAVRPDTFSEKEFEDLIFHRRSMKAPMTQLALNGIVSQFAKSGKPIAWCIQEMANRGWKGFKAEWVIGDKKKGGYIEATKDKDYRIS